jgi:hypothetical protein
MEMDRLRRLLDAVDSAHVSLLAMIPQICCKRRHENGLPLDQMTREHQTCANAVISLPATV